METITVDQLIDDYRTSVMAHEEPGDGSAAWAARVNRVADHLLLIARDVANRGPAAVDQFGALVRDRDPRISISAAHHVLDFMQPDAHLRDAALEVIERAAAVPSTAAAGERLWLENYRAEQQDE